MSTVNFKYEHGDILEDNVTGFEGVVMVRAEYSTGCIHFGLAGRELNNNEPGDWHWFDQSRLKRTSEGAVEFVLEDATLGGPFPSGPQA